MRAVCARERVRRTRGRFKTEIASAVKFSTDTVCTTRGATVFVLCFLPTPPSPRFSFDTRSPISRREHGLRSRRQMRHGRFRVVIYYVSDPTSCFRRRGPSSLVRSPRGVHYGRTYVSRRIPVSRRRKTAFFVYCFRLVRTRGNGIDLPKMIGLWCIKINNKKPIETTVKTQTNGKSERFNRVERMMK